MPSTVEQIRAELALAVGCIEVVIDRRNLSGTAFLDAALQALRNIDALLLDVRLDARWPTVKSTKKAVDICGLVASEATGMLALAEAAGIAFAVDICADRHAVTSTFVCDPVQVSQVITNVLLNAFQYTGRGGRVALEFRHTQSGVALEISDSGPGVPQAEREAIFEFGIRGSTCGGAAGSGIGLFVVRRILTAHSGTIRVSDRAGGGARFSIAIPPGAPASFA